MNTRSSNPDTRPCPTCGKPALQRKDNPERPFCCTRCRELDLLKWLDEEHRIPGPPAELADDELPDEDWRRG